MFLSNSIDMMKNLDSCSFRTNLVSFRTFRRLLFPKPISWQGLFCHFLQQSGSRCKCDFMPNSHRNFYRVSNIHPAVVVLFYLFETAHESSIKKGESNDDKWVPSLTGRVWVGLSCHGIPNKNPFNNWQPFSYQLDAMDFKNVQEI